MAVIQEAGKCLAVGDVPADDGSVGALGLEGEQRALGRLGGEEMIAVVEVQKLEIGPEYAPGRLRSARTMGRPSRVR